MPRPDHSRTQAGPLALLWLLGIGVVAWLPLLIFDNLSPQPARSPIAATGPGTNAGVSASPSPKLPADPLLSAGLGVDSQTAALRPFDRAASFGAIATTPGPSAPFALLAARTPSSRSSQVLIPSTASASGAALLGGPLGLESLYEKAVVPAARTEQALRAAAPDRLQALPLHWRDHMAWLVNSNDHPNLMPAEVVRLPAPYLQQPEEIPLAVKPGGVAETTVKPSSPRSMQALERWTERQPPVPAGSVRPVMVVLEPIAPQDAPAPMPAASQVPPAGVPAAGASAAPEPTPAIDPSALLPAP